MAVTARTPWSQILNQFAEGLDAIPDQRSAEILVLKSSLDNPTASRDEDAVEVAAEAIRPQVTAQMSAPVAPQATAQASISASAQYAAQYAVAAELDPASGEDLSDWTATLDIINGMAGYADEQRSRVKEQAKSYKETLQDLQKELRDVHQRLRLFEKQAAETQLQADARVQRIQAEADAQVQDERLRERNAAYEVLASDLRRALDDVERYKGLVAQAQAQAEAKAREIQALAEARINAIQARADARVQRAEERAHAADQRVIVVEDWLTTFEEASRSLLPALRAPIAKAS